MTDCELVAERKRVATLPNCDRCGRFTSNPTHYSECIGSETMWLCIDELLCPRCAEDIDHAK